MKLFLFISGQKLKKIFQPIPSSDPSKQSTKPSQTRFEKIGLYYDVLYILYNKKFPTYSVTNVNIS